MITPQQLAGKVNKIIEVNKSSSTLKGTYFNPMFANKLKNKVEELKDFGINLVESETESENGSVVNAKIMDNIGNELDLGTILLNGVDIIVKKALVPIEKLVEFINNYANVGVQNPIEESKLKEIL